MENITLPTFAGMFSSLIFMTSTLPMLAKAFQTKDLRSYSPVQILLANLGNLLHWLYVASLPFGPIWMLHAFHTLTTGLMLVLYLRYELGRRWHWQAALKN